LTFPIQKCTQFENVEHVQFSELQLCFIQLFLVLKKPNNTSPPPWQQPTLYNTKK